MKSIAQIDQEQDIKSLIFLFLKLIGLKKLSHRVNFKRKSKFDLVWLFSYLLELRFSRHSLFRAGKRRAQARWQMNNVAVELIRQAVSLGVLGVSAKYFLFDSWFSSLKMFFHLKQLGLDGLGMIKRSAKAYYVYRHRHYDIKGLYNRLAASKITIIFIAA